MSATQSILSRCTALGFARVGICDARPSSHADHVARWIAEGRHGEMQYLASRVELRLDPRALIPGAASIIVVADRYADGRPDRRGRSFHGRIARYARGRDYHVVLRRRLELLRDECLVEWPQHRFRVCVDTAPLLEREHAARAGLGAIGKNTLLIEPGVGSWLLLGAIVSTMHLELPGHSLAGDPCGTCTRCITACPTGCIDDWSVDASVCVSYLTLEHRSVIDEGVHAAIGDWLAGCDVCQEVCPHSQPTRRARRAPIREEYAALRDGFDVLSILEWQEEDRRRVAEGTPLERISLPMLQRNAAIVAVNTCPPGERAALRERLTRIAADPGRSEIVRAAAEVGVRRLGGAAEVIPNSA
jgi:epoxyqueuosine reductase